MVKSVGGTSADSPSSSWTGTAGHLADQVVQRDVDGTASRPVTADRGLHRQVGRVQAGRGGVDLADGLEEQREDGRHRGRRLAVEPVRVALPHPDDPRVPVVPELDDDRGHAVRGGMVGAGDAERVAQAEVQDLVGQPQAHLPAFDVSATHGSASIAARVAAQSRPAPNRTGSSTGSPVSAAVAAMIARASSSSG